MAAPVNAFTNEHLKLTLHDDGSFRIEDPSGRAFESHKVALQEEGPVDVGHVWLRTERSICEQFPGRFRLDLEGDAFRVTVLGHSREPVGSFRLEVTLDGPWACFRISDISDSLPSLSYPPSLEAESLVIPKDVGRWIRQPLDRRFVWSFWSHLRMRFFGYLRGDSGCLAVFHQGHADAALSVAEMAAAPMCLRTLGKWGNGFEVRYRLTEGGYVGLAKAFRAYAKEQGRFVSLEEKRSRFPALDALIGGRILSFMCARPQHGSLQEDLLRARESSGSHLKLDWTYAQVLEAIRQAQAWGVDKALVQIRGWIKGGYDDSHPDVWPPEPALGTVAELEQLCQNPMPFPVSLHDNYQDIYERCPSFPEGIVLGPTGKRMAGGIWAGGQCYILNSRDSLRLAKRNWEHLGSLGMSAFFPDTITAERLRESFEPGNELTRAQDEELKLEMLRFWEDQGVMVGSEEAADFGIPHVAWLENRHGRVPGESIPLWPLVFHDAVVNARYIQGAAAGEPNAGHLVDLLWGYVRLTGGDRARWTPDRFVDLEVDRWHGRIGLAEMVDHAYLGDGSVERTEWSTSDAITVNFGEEPFDGIPPKGYRVN